MPIPNPNPSENRTDFIQRCMEDEKMNDEYDVQQRYAVCQSAWTEIKVEKIKVSFDYDGTLSTAKGMELAQKEINKGNIVYIISARSSKPMMYSRADKLNIPHSQIFATGSNKAKVEKIIELGISKHYDNNPDVIKELGVIGKLI
jgi:hypothetical protein